MAFEGKVVKGESERSEWQQGTLPTNVWMPLIFYQGLTLRSKDRRLATKIHWYLVEGKLGYVRFTGMMLKLVRFGMVDVGHV